MTNTKKDKLWFNFDELPNLLSSVNVHDINALLGTSLNKVPHLYDRSIIFGGSKEKKQSLSFFKKDGVILFKDHGTGQSGSVINLLQEVRGLSYSDAIVAVAEHTGYNRIFTDYYKSRNNLTHNIKPVDPSIIKAREEHIAQEKLKESQKESAKIKVASNIYNNTSNAEFVGEHYLKRKGFENYGTLNGVFKQSYDSHYEQNFLAFPIYDLDGKFKGIQKLFDSKIGDNDKRFLGSQDMASTPIFFDADKKKWSTVIPNDFGGQILVTEGVATCLSSISSIYDGNSSVAGVVAFNSGNLVKTLPSIIEKYPNASFIISVDRDALMINDKSIQQMNKDKQYLEDSIKNIESNKYTDDYKQKFKVNFDKELLKYHNTYNDCHSTVEYDLRELFRNNPKLNERCLIIIPDVPAQFDKQVIKLDNGVFKTQNQKEFYTDFNDFHKYIADSNISRHKNIEVTPEQFSAMVPPSLKTTKFKNLFETPQEYESFINSSNLNSLHMNNSLTLSCTRKALLGFAREAQELFNQGDKSFPTIDSLNSRFQSTIEKFTPPYAKQFVEAFGDNIIANSYSSMKVEYEAQPEKVISQGFNLQRHLPSVKGLSYEAPNPLRQIQEIELNSKRGLKL